MEKTFQLDQNEQQTVAGMEDASLRLNARYGQLSREMKDVETRLLASEEQQRAFIRQALTSRGVQRFEAAQIVQGGQLMARVADESMALQPTVVEKVPEKVNGQVRHAE